MSKELGPLEVVCDAPPYPIVKACGGLGFLFAQDVRWCRADRRGLQRSPVLIPWARGRAPSCSCGQPVPALESYTFTFVSGGQAQYYLGQCGRCRTIYWDKA